MIQQSRKELVVEGMYELNALRSEGLFDEVVEVGLVLLPSETHFSHLGDEDKLPYAHLCSECAEAWIRAGADWLMNVTSYKCDLCGIEPTGFDAE